MPSAVLPGFTEVSRPRWSGGREITLYSGPRHCRRCSHGLLVPVGSFIQHALFVHGGYGAGEASEVELCLACGAVNRVRVGTVKPWWRD